MSKRYSDIIVAYIKVAREKLLNFKKRNQIHINSDIMRTV